MNKLESSPSYLSTGAHYLPWHAHITALTVSPSSRRLGLARVLSSSLESAGNAYNAFFIDLFVRKSNTVAQELYKGLGYSVFRTVKEYYIDNPGKGDKGDDKEGGGEDAYDMRKALEKDKDRKHVRENGESYEISPEDVW